MNSDKDVESARLVTMTAMLVLGVVSLIFFAIYWFCCRRSRIPGVVLALPNSVQPNTGAPNNVMVVGQNAQGPPYPAMGAVPNNHGTCYPVMAVNPQIGAQYPAGAGPINHAVTTQEAPPSYSQTQQQMDEQAPLFKPAMQY